MNTWEFTGIGNFSHCFNWDNGLQSAITHDLKKNNSSLSYTWNEGGVAAGHYVAEAIIEDNACLHFYLSEYGGTRKVWGEVSANTIEEANQLLSKLDNRWEVIVYERPEDVVENNIADGGRRGARIKRNDN